MSLLQYTSKEMYSSTELIRKSKKIFDKLTRNELEKAIILRDGKPSFMLLDFQKYEDIMSEYLAMKSKLSNKTLSIQTEEKVEENIKEDLNMQKSKNINIKPENIKSVEEISDLDLQDALAKIEKIGNKISMGNKETNSNKIETNSEQNIKEFWD